MITTIHHRDTETQRKAKKAIYALFFSVPLCLCGGKNFYET